MFTSVRRDLLQKAFAKAHKCAVRENYPPACRAEFYDIAKLIWEAHGEAKEMPHDAGAIASAIVAAEERAAKRQKGTIL